MKGRIMKNALLNLRVSKKDHLMSVEQIPMRGLALLLMFFLACIAHAQDNTENVYFELPPGFVEGFKDRDESFFIREWVPKGESVDGWSEMLTLTIQDMPNVDPVEFFNRMAEGWKEACPEYGGMLLHEGRENNYPVAIWFLKCPVNPMTNKPEFTYIKGIAGNENFYTVQLAYALHSEEITDSTMNYSMGFLKRVTVCDNSRPQAHACH